MTDNFTKPTVYGNNGFLVGVVKFSGAVTLVLASLFFIGGIKVWHNPEPILHKMVGYSAPRSSLFSPSPPRFTFGRRATGWLFIKSGSTMTACVFAWEPRKIRKTNFLPGTRSRRSNIGAWGMFNTGPLPEK